jgi:hypothetical protein
MTYQEKKQASKKVLDAIKALKDNEVLEVAYGKGYKGKPNVYTIRAYSSESAGMSYSIWSTFSGMNISSLGPTTAKAYTFDMMSQKTTYTFPLYEMEIGLNTPKEDNPLEKLEGYIGTEKGELV